MLSLSPEKPRLPVVILIAPKHGSEIEYLIGDSPACRANEIIAAVSDVASQQAFSSKILFDDYSRHQLTSNK